MWQKFISLTLLAVFLAQPIAARAEDGVTTPVQRLGTGLPTSIAVSPDGVTLAVGSSLGVWFLNAATLQPFDFWDTGEWVNSVAYSVDGHYLHVNTRVYETASDAQVEINPDSVQWVNNQCIENGRTCAMPFGFLIKVENSWNKSGFFLPVGTFADEVAWSPDGNRLFGVVGAEVVAWNVGERRLVQRLNTFFTGPLEQVIWSVDGTEIASGKAIWNNNSAQLVRSRECSSGYLRNSFNCQWPKLWLETSYTIYFFDQHGRATKSFVPHHISTTTSAPSNDGTKLVTSGADVLQCRVNFCRVTKSSTRIWDARTLQQLTELPALFYAAQFSADGQIVIGRTQQGIEAWHWQTGQQLWVVVESIRPQCDPQFYANSWCRDRSHGLSAHPSNDFIAAFSPPTGSSVRLYRLTTGELVTTFKGHTAPITEVAFSHDGTKIAASSLDGTILIWNVP